MPDQEDGSNLFQRLDRERLATGEIAPELLAPAIPFAGQHIWEWFWELDSGREEGFNGLTRISHQHIAAWSGMTEKRLRDFEIQIIMAMDRVRLRESSPAAVEKRALAKRGPLTPALFDAMFGGKR